MEWLFLVVALALVVALVWLAFALQRTLRLEQERNGLNAQLNSTRALLAQQQHLAVGLHQELVQAQARLQQAMAENTQLQQQASALREQLGNIPSLSQAEQDATFRIHSLEVTLALQKRQGEEEQRALELRIKKLQTELAALEEQELLQAHGFYQLRFKYDTSARYAEHLNDLWDHEKSLIKQGRAAVCHIDWTVGGDRRAGEKMVKDQQKLMLRAFNGECDAAVAKVKFNNFSAMDKRVRASFEAINKIGESTRCVISPAFLQLKIDALQLTFEQQEQKQKELEEQRALREQMKEEERAQRELEQAKKESEKEQARFAQALEKAQREIAASTGAQKHALEAKIAELTAQLTAATAKQKAASLAQQTSVGHVYIISNIGSFGEDVFKIGMTRRLEPQDRVDELGDASVPFQFDVHAMVKTGNAPEFERRLHERFADRRVNKVNERKEFFRVSLDEIAREVESVAEQMRDQLHREVTFTRTALAEEYRKSLAMAER